MAFSYTIIGLTLLADDCTIHSVTKQKMNNTIGVIRCGWKGISIPGRCYDNNFACTTGLYVNGLDIVYIFVQCLYKIGLIVLIMSSSKNSHVRNLNQLSQGVATVCVSLCPPATWGNGLVWQSTAFYSDSARWASAPSSISLISTSLGDRFFAASSA